MLFFCTPVHSSAQACTDVTSYHPLLLSQHFPSPMNICSAACTQRLRVEPRVQGVSAWSCGLIIFIEHRMLVHEPVHGMQGVLDSQGLWVFTFCPPMRKFRQAIESEGEAFRMSEARRLASLHPALMSVYANAGCFRNVLRTIEHAVKNIRRVPFFGSPFLRTQER